MNERLKVLCELAAIDDDYCKGCVITTHDGKVIKKSNRKNEHCRMCPHLERIRVLGQTLGGMKTKDHTVRKQKQLSSRNEGNTLAKGPKWKQSGITVATYQKLRNEEKTDRQIADKYGIGINDIQAFKKASGLVKAQQTPQEVAQVPTNESVEQEVTESTKSDTTQTDTEKQLIDANLTIVKYKSKITQAAKELEEKNEQLAAAAERIGELESKLATPAITHDDYELFEQQKAKLENQIEQTKVDLVRMSNTINDYEQKLEANTVKLAEIVAQNKQLQAENEQLRVESVKDVSVHKLLQEKISLQLHNTKLKQELDELLADREAEKQHPPIQFETANPYIEMHDEQLIKNEQLTERVQELEDLVDQLMNDNGDLMQELQDVEELNYLNVLQFVKTYSQNKVNKRAIRNLERKTGETA